MLSATAKTMVKMLETLPEELQDRVLEHMRDYMEDIKEEARWTESFSRTQDNLVAAARRARRAREEGKATAIQVHQL